MLMLDGVTGLSEVRFQEDENYKAAMGYNHDDDNLFMYHNGNLKFSNGNLHISNDYNYISDKTVTMQFPVFAFTPSGIGDWEDDLRYYSDGKLVHTVNDDDWIGTVYCPLNLPDEAVITSISLVCYVELDTTLPIIDKYLDFELKRRGFTETSASVLAQINVYDSGGIIDEFSTTTISNSMIDNSDYQYYLLCTVAHTSTEFWGAKITYTISKISY
jgi:hypothetical protein